VDKQQNPIATARWDAGDAGCGRLISGLRNELRRLSAGETLEVTATDAAAPIDIGVWCSMTGNPLVYETHPVYVIQRCTG